MVDTVWRNSEVVTKERLAEELIAHEAELANDFYGRIVLRNCNIAHYRRKQAVWQEKMATAEKTRELFQDILEDVQTDVNTGSRKRKKNKETVLPLIVNKKRKK